MKIIYGAIGESGLRVAQMYAERYFNWLKPQQQMSARVHEQLCETESVSSTCPERRVTDQHGQFQSRKLSCSVLNTSA